MPLTLTLTKGAIAEGTEGQAIKELTDAILKHHGLTGNKVMTPNVTAHFSVLDKNATFSGGKPFVGVWIEIKIPSFGFSDREVQKAFCDDAVEIIQRLSGGKQPKDNIYFNVTHTVNGTWAMNGIALTDDEVLEEVSKG